MYHTRGFGDASGMTTTPAQGLPLVTVSQYALPSCGFGQKTVGSGPFTCQFDMGTALAQAWQFPGAYVSLFAPAGMSANTYSAIGWAAIVAIGWFAFGGKGGR